MKTMFIQMSNECYDGGNAANAWVYVKNLQTQTNITFDHVILKREAIRADAPVSRLGISNRLWTDASVWETKVSGGSVATINHDTLFEAFLNSNWGLLPAYHDDNDYLFSVIDHNSAHHISYLLACWAFKKRGRKDAVKIVINFDQHEDYGYKTPKTKINCGAWGCYIINGPPAGSRFRRPGFKVGNYVSVGNGKKVGGIMGRQGEHVGRHTCASGKFYTNIYKAGAKGDHSPSAVVIADKNNLLKKLGTKMGHGLIPWDIYVSVDRDCIQGNDTPYGHGVHKPEEVRHAVYNLLRDMRNTRSQLVGFDVIGLPHHTSTNKAIAYKDISQLYNIALQYTNPTWNTTYDPNSATAGF